MKKELFAFSLALALLFSVSACGAGGDRSVVPPTGGSVSTEPPGEALPPEESGGRETFDWKTLREGDFEVTDGMIFRGGSMASSGGTGDFGIYTVSFDPADYVVIPFTGFAGVWGYLHEHAERAGAMGYEVAAVINGDFFDMTGSTAQQLNSYLMFDGRVAFCNSTRTTRMTLISSGGAVTCAEQSKLTFRLWLNSRELKGGVTYVNWRYITSLPGGWTDAVYYYDDLACEERSPYPGVLVRCRKLYGGELTVGNMLEGRVLSVQSGAATSEVPIGEDEFILWAPESSANAGALAALAPGDSVMIAAEETLPASAEQTPASPTALANLGWLIKDGVDLAKDDSFNAGAPHSNTTQAHWTAFGTRDDGSWMFFTSDAVPTPEGRVALTLKDVAEWMLAQGVTNAIRLDGGGSTGLWVCSDASGQPGYIYHSEESDYGRPVSDCLMVVRRSSPALAVSDGQREELAALMEAAADTAPEALTFARRVAEDPLSVSADYRTAVSRLRWALSGKAELLELIGKAGGVDFAGYTPYALGELRAAWRQARAVFTGEDPGPEEVAAARADLERWYGSTGALTVDGVTEEPIGGDGMYLSGVNTRLESNRTCVYTAGTELTNMNLAYAKIVLLKWDGEAGLWRVTRDVFSAAGALKTIEEIGFSTVPEGMAVIAAHNGGSALAQRNDACISQVRAGQILALNGLSLTGGDSEPGAYFTFD